MHLFCSAQGLAAAQQPIVHIVSIALKSASLKNALDYMDGAWY